MNMLLTDESEIKDGEVFGVMSVSGPRFYRKNGNAIDGPYANQGMTEIVIQRAGGEEWGLMRHENGNATIRRLTPRVPNKAMRRRMEAKCR